MTTTEPGATEDKFEQAAEYLGMSIERVKCFPVTVIDAVTSDDLGTVPPEFLASPLWDVMTPDDRDQLLRFRLFLNAIGPALKIALTAAKEPAG
jgi:hypothetical protein